MKTLFPLNTPIFIRKRDSSHDLPGEFAYIGPASNMIFVAPFGNSTVPDEYHQVKCIRAEAPYEVNQIYVCSERRISTQSWETQIATPVVLPQKRGRKKSA